jgi:hypothetical protein
LCRSEELQIKIGKDDCLIEPVWQHAQEETPPLLTDAARTALNSALARYRERILDSPVVVEGYPDGDEVNDRLAASRHRAILVRNYLHSRFKLDTSRVGTVALENRPPDGSPDTSWNGVAIVLAKVKH